MADQKKPNPSTDKQIPNNVVSLVASKCTSEGCNKKPSKAGFCDEHYVWFKEGLITTEGYKAKDFDKKYHAFMSRKKVA